jgi:hypothetical protein
VIVGQRTQEIDGIGRDAIEVAGDVTGGVVSRIETRQRQ